MESGTFIKFAGIRPRNNNKFRSTVYKMEINGRRARIIPGKNRFPNLKWTVRSRKGPFSRKWNERTKQNAAWFMRPGNWKLPSSERWAGEGGNESEDGIRALFVWLSVAKRGEVRVRSREGPRLREHFVVSQLRPKMAKRVWNKRFLIAFSWFDYNVTRLKNCRCSGCDSEAVKLQFSIGLLN